MTSRTYLSIGDVLTLLREEFPDVTISKIRFLESQGLVNPERSPSGYRKFFETDVERLRWVLRQQREHFLPLKVIRDRLADGDLSEGGAEPAIQGAQGNGRSPERAHAVAGAGHAGGAAASAGAGVGTATAPRTAEQSTQADDEAMARIVADASRRAARVPESVSGHALLEAVPDPGAPPLPGPSEVLDVPRARDLPHAPDVEGLRADPDAPAATAAPGAAATVAVTTEAPAHEVTAAALPEPTAVLTPAPAVAQEPAPSPHDVFSRAAAAVVGTPGEANDVTGGVGRHAAGGETGESHGAGEGRAASADAPAPAPRAETGRSAPEKRAGAGGVTGVGRAAGSAGTGGKASGPGNDRGAAAGGTSSPSTSAIVTGASLTTEELCAASGLSEIELAGLQGFGLLEPVMVAGIPTFDEDALTVANLAAEFRKFGIEARHLRPYRNAVDREMGLIEQVIIPLLRQRNPESRQRALDAADELGALGQTMRATLLRTAMRRHLGG